MPYIVREDGEQFVVPSYRDILSAKKAALLKKEILLLSANYGNYITLQRKNEDQYEAAFANDPGYLLGESVWHYFKCPLDMIYCESIPNTADALLVIVKSGSVYLDGSFPIDSIPDELLIFKTQPGNFEIYIHGNIPISEKSEEGKFSLDGKSVKSFNILPDPLFPTLPLLSQFKLTPAELVLKKQGIGVVSRKTIYLGIGIPAAIFLMIMYFSIHKEQAPQFLVSTISPWKPFFDELNASPAPDQEILALMNSVTQLYSAPGWSPNKILYSNQTLSANMYSLNTNIAPLLAWASAQEENSVQVDIKPEGVFATESINAGIRKSIRGYYPLKYVLASVIDRVNSIWVGMSISLGDFIDNGTYTTTTIGISFNDVSFQTLGFLASQLTDMPLIMVKATINPNPDGTSFSGMFTFKALGK